MTDRKQKLAAVDAALSHMFKDLEARGLPEHLENVVDQLEASALSAPAPEKAPVAGVEPAVRPSPSPPSIQEP